MSFAGSLGSIFRGLNGTNDTLRDYKHASRRFGSDNYALLPKNKNQWYVSFKIMTGITPKLEQIIKDIGGDKGLFTLKPDPKDKKASLFSCLVKSVKLPSARFEVKKYNNYNKQIINVNKINYDPISVTFHDDSAGIVRSIWDEIYMYYVQDGRYRDISDNQSGLEYGKLDDHWWDYSPVNPGSNPELYISDSLYHGEKVDRQHHYGLDTVSKDNRNKVTGYLDRQFSFLTSIHIYHFTRPHGTKSKDESAFAHWHEYMLVNPVLTGWDQDTLDHASGEFTSCTMNLEYETIKYSIGKIEDDKKTGIAGFDNVISAGLYDREKSPLPGPGQQVLSSIFEAGVGLATGTKTLGQVLSPQNIITNARNVATWAGVQVPGVNAAVPGNTKLANVANTAINSVQTYYAVGPTQITVPSGSGALTKALPKVFGKNPPTK